jgi:hypothetical protein
LSALPESLNGVCCQAWPAHRGLVARNVNPPDVMRPAGLRLNLQASDASMTIPSGIDGDREPWPSRTAAQAWPGWRRWTFRRRGKAQDRGGLRPFFRPGPGRRRRHQAARRSRTQLYTGFESVRRCSRLSIRSDSALDRGIEQPFIASCLSNAGNSMQTRLWRYNRGLQQIRHASALAQSRPGLVHRPLIVI